MKVALLHTLQANQALFDACLVHTQLGEFVDIVHYCAPELLQYASEVGIDDTLTALVAQQVLDIEAQGADWVVCTCSSIGRLAEQAITQRAKVIRVDRPMAIAASQVESLTVLAALETTIKPTMALLAEYATDIKQTAKIAVIEGAWPHYLDGDLQAYQQTIADYIQQYCAEDSAIMLAQASMAPAVSLLPHCLQSKVLTSPTLCIEYLLTQVARRTEPEVK